MRRWLERQRYLVDYTLAALGRRKLRNLGLLSAYSFVVFLVASVMLFSLALRREAGALLAGAPEITVQRLVMGRHEMMRPEDIERLKGIRGARGVEGRLWGYFYDAFSGATFTVMVPPPSKERYTPPPGKARIGEGVARLRDRGPGETLMLVGPGGMGLVLEVGEVFPAESALVSSDMILVSEEHFRAFFHLPEDIYTDVAMKVRNPREVPKVLEKILRRFPDGRVIAREDVLRTYEYILDWREGFLLVVLLGAVLAFAVLAWDKASGLSANERREIGILKAVGWSTADVLKMKLWEGALVSTAAFVIGYLAAYVHVFEYGAPALEPALKGWSVLYPRFPLTPAVDELQLASLFLLTVLPYSAATLVPVWRAATMDPDTVMRG